MWYILIWDIFLVSYLLLMPDGSGRLLEKNSSRDVLEKRTAGGRRILFILVSFDANLSTIRLSFKRCKRNCADHENFLTSNCRPHLKNVCPSAPWEDSSEVQNHDLCSLLILFIEQEWKAFVYFKSPGGWSIFGLSSGFTKSATSRPWDHSRFRQGRC